MGDLTTTTKGVGDLMKTGEQNPKGMIGVIALAVITVGLVAIKAISGGK